MSSSYSCLFKKSISFSWLRVLICLLSNAWVGETFKVFTVITHKHTHNLHKHTQRDRCLQHHMCTSLRVGINRALGVCLCQSECAYMCFPVAVWLVCGAWLTKRAIRWRSNKEGTPNFGWQMSSGRREGWWVDEKKAFYSQTDFLLFVLSSSVFF